MLHRDGRALKAVLIPGWVILAAFFMGGCGKIGDPVPPDMAAPPAITGVAPQEAAGKAAAGADDCGAEPKAMGKDPENKDGS